ncbi:iron-siderophore ABC transporter substrate-binding protein [Schumannella luteola]|uniref:Iron complex transport system substrate-binding protein n=1 Tax=Schumannella luteola TaxID=472059 RepID=A0A852YAP3_9MICO|nr:iron-siderophore ABC transporter substrate-binding protein [Schumannella luteola]NYG98922.1 iron complex transport system substrate-binding protein [Schumannella luteola]TPX06298.1 iron-siderophore ABC transporter substrate-binding protein [Schumannella luteola]
MHQPRLIGRLAIAALAAATLALTGCSAQGGADDAASSSDSAGYPIKVTSALGTATITEKPTRVATVNWANHEVPLALGVVPVGMARSDFGDDDGDGLLPWVKEKLDDLDAKTPVLFDETDGIDFAAVADTEPDVILAAYSGLTQEDYDKLSKIAPVVAYPEAPWATSWRDSIEIESKALGLAKEGEALIADIDASITEAVESHPQLEGKTAMFLTHVDPSDLSKVSFYTAKDTRAAFFGDLDLATPKSIEKLSGSSDKFSGTISAENSDVFADVDIIVTYGDDELIATLKGDPVLSKIPAVANDAIVALPGTGPIGTAANPTPLSISWVLSDYVDLLAGAADKSA